ncbi:hypothetical protein UK23_08415 [Lentzea aerocolonigenes]|uniref:ATP-grasp domain-containing protein n=1 Tax=Lentzea aerocolonigenes TaxID=68170 RepID=A0A0F0HBJ9_LENAE|nr:hypothetical protein [Lentzea aerocolonigenes]KJK51003.1 hypothetical protein UK23_08415 [Lentzea aerocolonigenes]
MRENSITASALTPTLAAPRTLTDIYGPDVTVCARPAQEPAVPSSRHRNTRDVLSARPLAVAADTPVITSAGGTEPNLLAALLDGGLPVCTDPREFRTEAEFALRVTEALSDGLRLSMEYPQPANLHPDERSVKSAELVGYLNNKASISTFVDPRFQARREILGIDELAQATPVEKSWVLKAATNAAHGASLDVYLHRAGDPVTLPAFTDILTEVVVEEYLHIHRNWGIQLYVAADGRARLLAVTDQRIDADGIYTGGRFGLVVPLPADLLTECLAIAQRAADVGYRGVCSLDCAQTYDGRLVMLDLNFRITSGSIPLLALHTIRPDALDRPSESTKLTTAAPIAALLAALQPALQRGGLLVTGGHDTRRTDNPVNQATLHLLVFGDDPDDVTTRRTALEAMYGRR